jgi:lambda family phage portal protein
LRRGSWQHRLASAIDVAIEVFSPNAAARRQLTRNRLELARRQYQAMSAAYAGASKERPRDGWLPPGASADADLLPELATLRERSRDLNRNDPYARGITDAMVDNIVGTGLRPQSRVDHERLGVTPEAAAEWQSACELVWKLWDKQRIADSTQRNDFGGLQRLAFRSAIENGDSFVHPVMVDAPGRPLALALEVIEADRVATPGGDTFAVGGVNAERQRTRMGIELGQRGEPIAYHVAKWHPGPFSIGVAPTDFKRVPAVDQAGRPGMLHVYRQKRPGQTRGEPLFAAAMASFDNLGGYIESELMSARVAACFSAFVKTANPIDMQVGRTTAIEQGQRIEELVPGIVQYLGIGEDVQFADPSNRVGSFAPFVQAVLRAIGASLNLPYEVVAKDFSQVNYSSARAALLEARRMFRCWQVHLAMVLCQPVWALHVEEAWLRGLLPNVPLYDDFEGWTNAGWIAPGWGWVDPTKEIEASQMAISNGFSTLADECASQGRDWEETLVQIARERKVAEELGIELPSAASATPAPFGGEAGEDDEPTEDEGEEGEPATADEPETEEVPA